MTDYRSMFDRDYLGAWDLPKDRDAVVTIEKVVAGTLSNGTKKSKKPILFFAGKEKGMACNKTNAKAIAAMYGNDVSQWVGKRIALYPTTTSFGSEQVECIRVRPTPPQPKTKQQDEAAS